MGGSGVPGNGSELKSPGQEYLAGARRSVLVVPAGAEMAQRGLVGAQCRVAQVPDRAHVPEILLDLGRGPLPWKFIHMVHEPADIPDALVNGVELQVAR